MSEIVIANGIPNEKNTFFSKTVQLIFYFIILINQNLTNNTNK